MNQSNHNRSSLLLISGVIGVLGSFAVVAANIIGILLVEQHNPISETISKLAIGDYAWIQDLGLDLFAISLFAIAIGLFKWSVGGWRWQTGAFLLILLCFDILVIAEHNQYAGQDNSGANIHIHAVYVLGLLVALAALLLGFDLRRISRNWSRFSIGLSIVWTVLGPIFFVVPTSWNGAYERFVALIMVTWVVALSGLLIQRGSGQLKAKV